MGQKYHAEPRTPQPTPTKRDTEFAVTDYDHEGQLHAQQSSTSFGTSRCSGEIRHEAIIALFPEGSFFLPALHELLSARPIFIPIGDVRGAMARVETHCVRLGPDARPATLCD